MRRAERSLSARARVVERRPLRYDAELAARIGAPWVRAGSSLVRFGSRLMVVQDDALWLATLDPSGALSAEALPAPLGAPRVFDDKRLKPDFEAAAALGERLLVFGSGSLPSRERIALVEADGRTRLVDASAFYAALRAEPQLAAGGLNLEGAVGLGPTLLLASRGNSGENSFDATVELDAAALLRYLDAPRSLPPPTLGRVERYWLDQVGEVSLTLTDLAVRDGRLYYVAAAEASPDAVADGPVLGVAFGTLGELPQYTLIEAESGAPCCDKIEGLVAGDAPGDWLAVVDADDIRKPCELLRLQVTGF